MNILILDDEPTIRETLAMALETQGHKVWSVTTGGSAIKGVEEKNIDVVFLDLKIRHEDGLDILPELLKASPNLAVIIITAYASIESTVEAMRLGAFDYLAKPFKPAQIAQVLERVATTRKMENRIRDLESRVENPEISFVSQDPSMKEILATADKAAASHASILILGESGTGKSVLARHIHEKSLRANEPFVTVSCPSLSRELLESELFGHCKGAFTGALSEKWGKVAAAEKGTLFLDEIGELPLEIQPKLLRLLQEREYERVGETKVRRADVRVIAATNRNLKEAINRGTFREDLFYRLNVITLEVPPLRNRPHDILSIAEQQLHHFSRQMGRKIDGFDSDAEKFLLQHSWPGNLRELRNALERAVIMASGEKIQRADFPAEASTESSDITLGGKFSLEQIENEHIRRILARSSSIQETCQILQIDPTTLLRKRKKHGLDD